MTRRTAFHCLLWLFSLCTVGGTPAAASEWDGQTVLLMFGRPAGEHAFSDQIEAELQRLRESLRPQMALIPFITMRLGETGTDPVYMQRLGFKEADLPVICVVEWGNPARFGPKKVRGGSIVRQAEPRQAAAMVNAFLAATGRETRVPEPPDPDALLRSTPGKVELDAVRFEIGGTVLNVAARVRNADNRRLEKIKVRFYFRLPEATEWTLLEEQEIPALAAGHVAARDHLTDTARLGLVSTVQKPAHAFYRVEVDHLGKTSSREGEYRSPGV